MLKSASSVFGVSNTILQDSYVDRGGLDSRFSLLLTRTTHIALRGESKSGKSWLRQRNISNPLTIQCRLRKTTLDIYKDALSQLDVQLDVERTHEASFKGRVEATGELGVKLLSKLGVTFAAERDSEDKSKSTPVGRDISDLKFVADLIKASERRLVIEDFHYLSLSERSNFAFDLKALWDYGLFVVIVGVWSKDNMLLYLNPDLTGRIQELSLSWSQQELRQVLRDGAQALNIAFSPALEKTATHDSFGNVGILQRLALEVLDHLTIQQEQSTIVDIDDLDALEFATMQYAEQLNSRYQQFAQRITSGIRRRRDSTGIYAYAMAAIMESSDTNLQAGLSLDVIFDLANKREPRIQKGNLRTILERFENLQVDDDGRGLVLAYNEAKSEITVVDKQLLLYRHYSTIKWPWEDLIVEASRSISAFEVSSEEQPSDVMPRPETFNQ